MNFFKKNNLQKVMAAVFGVIALLGAIMIFNRSNPLDKSIGDVVVTNGADRIALDCHKYSYNNRNGKSLIDTFIPIEKDKKIPVIAYYPHNEDCKIAVSYSERYKGELSYNVYDSDFNPVVEEASSLTLPVEPGNIYYVSVAVDWGEDDEDKTVTCKYYFSIDVKGE